MNGANPCPRPVAEFHETLEVSGCQVGIVLSKTQFDCIGIILDRFFDQLLDVASRAIDCRGCGCEQCQIGSA